MQKITSRDNAKLKLARRVRDGREKDSVFIEGVRLAEEAVRSEIKIREAFVTEDFARNERGAKLIDQLQSKNLSASELSENLLQSIADTKNAQGIILIADKASTSKQNFEKRFQLQKSILPIVIFLSEINNPSNLGAILRTAEGADAAGVVVSRNSADPFSPKSLRASMGAAFRLNIWANAGFNDVLFWARENDLTTTAADIDAEKSYDRIDWTKPRLLVFGSEAHGLDAQDFRRIDEALLIPMENEVESLNLAVSCGIILFEGLRQIKNRQ